MFDKWFKKSQVDQGPEIKTPKATEDEALKQRVIDVLRTIYDPEIPLNIYDLGLIYEIKANEYGMVAIKMTLTAPGCPVAQSFPGMVEAHVMTVEGVNEVKVEIVWDPPWDYERMSESARLQLGLM